jgi:hypothetical protein
MKPVLDAFLTEVMAKPLVSVIGIHIGDVVWIGMLFARL